MRLANTWKALIRSLNISSRSPVSITLHLSMYMFCDWHSEEAPLSHLSITTGLETRKVNAVRKLGHDAISDCSTYEALSTCDPSTHMSSILHSNRNTQMNSSTELPACFRTTQQSEVLDTLDHNRAAACLVGVVGSDGQGVNVCEDICFTWDGAINKMVVPFVWQDDMHPFG
jgi:hypothetical protein